MIYFLHIESGERAGTTKVGASHQPGSRVVNIAGTLRCSVTLHSVMPGGATEEVVAHEALASHRVMFGREREFFLREAAESYAERSGATVVRLPYAKGDRLQGTALRAIDPVYDGPAQMLDAALSARIGLAADLARAAGVSQMTVSRWRHGEALPPGLAARVIERRCDIDRRLWEPLRAARRAE